MPTTNNINTYIVPTSTREVTQPSQPAFLALYGGAGIANVTGDSTFYTCPFPTEIFDQNADFADPTFTAPVTGRYLFSGSINIATIAAHTDFYVIILTSNRSYYAFNVNPGVIKNGANGLAGCYEQLTDMDAGDIANIQIVVTAGAKTITYWSGSYFSGALII